MVEDLFAAMPRPDPFRRAVLTLSALLVLLSGLPLWSESGALWEGMQARSATCGAVESTPAAGHACGCVESGPARPLLPVLPTVPVAVEVAEVEPSEARWLAPAATVPNDGALLAAHRPRVRSGPPPRIAFGFWRL